MMNKEGKGRCTLFTPCDLVWWWGGCGAPAAGVHGREEGLALSSGHHVHCKVLLF